MNNKFKILKNKKQVKFEDTYFTLQNYKEPLQAMLEEKGYGFYGTLLNTLDGEYIQCHICGKLFKDLTQHLKKHKITSREYKEQFSLAYSTSLCSEKEREKRKIRTLNWLSNLTDNQKREYRKKALDKIREYRETHIKIQPKLQLETLNKRGVCPLQLLEKIIDVKIKMNRTPTLKEFILLTGGQRYKHLIFKTFGSWQNALNTLHLKNCRKTKKKNLFYSDEELLQYLKIFYDTNKIQPTETDALRGMIPETGLYRRRFGSFVEAKRIAGII